MGEDPERRRARIAEQAKYDAQIANAMRHLIDGNHGHANEFLLNCKLEDARGRVQAYHRFMRFVYKRAGRPGEYNPRPWDEELEASIRDGWFKDE